MKKHTVKALMSIASTLHYINTERAWLGWTVKFLCLSVRVSINEHDVSIISLYNSLQAPLQPSIDPEITGCNQKLFSEEPTDNYAAGRVTCTASWDNCATNKIANENQHPFSSPPNHSLSERCTGEENANLMPVSSGSGSVMPRRVAQCSRDDNDAHGLTSDYGCVPDDGSASLSSQCSEGDSFSTNSQGSEQSLDYDPGCSRLEPQHPLSSHTELIHDEPPSKPGLKPAIKSEEALLKTRTQRSTARRRVTFSDSIALISLAVDDECEDVNYMSYVASTLATQPSYVASTLVTQPTSQGPVADTTVRLNTGSSDGAESVDRNASDKVECTLCRKRLVDVADMYCPDCQHYMSRFTPLISRCWYPQWSLINAF